MKLILSLATMVAALTLLLNGTPSAGQTPTCQAPGCNPTVSDVNENTAGGTGALSSVNAPGAGGSSNTAFGAAALEGNTTGDQNTATGSTALLKNTTGSQNTAAGFQALFQNTSGSHNTAYGNDALLENTTGSHNTAAGSDALIGNTTGESNTASGADALNSNTTGTANTASGAQALSFNDTGNFNTASGFQALNSNSAGYKNTAVGSGALFNSTGNKNIAVGFNAGVNLTSGNNNVYIGSAGNSSESQTIRVGEAQSRTFISGITGASVSNAAQVIIDTATGQLGIPVSSARYKRDVAPMGTQSEKVLSLRPVTFVYKDDAQGATHYGLIAEEVATVYPELVTRTAAGEVQTVRYQELIPMLLNELQRQRQELAELRTLVGLGRGAQALFPSTTGIVNGTAATPR